MRLETMKIVLGTAIGVTVLMVFTGLLVAADAISGILGTDLYPVSSLEAFSSRILSGDLSVRPPAGLKGDPRSEPDAVVDTENGMDVQHSSNTSTPPTPKSSESPSRP